MSTSYSASYFQSGATGAQATGHACHCIGCCRKCGSCRTNPLHTALYCARMVAWLQGRPR